MDAAGADPQKAAEYIESLGLETDIPEEGWEVETDGAFEVEITEGHQKGAEVAEYALQFVGNPYSWGSDSLTDGTDSSGFTKSVYAYFGICIPHDSRGQREVGTKVDALDKAMPGDLIFYETPAHVAIYLGEGKIVHAMPEHGICISEAEFDDVSEIRRIRD